MINWKELIPYLLKLRCDRQSDFANRFGVGQQTVSNWAKGIYKPSPESEILIIKYCLEIGVDANNFLKGIK